MTYEQREQIFAKDVLTIDDISLLLQISYKQASALVCQIKRNFDFQGKPVRITAKGRLHTQDYLDYFNIGKDNLRYCKAQKENYKLKENT